MSLRLCASVALFLALALGVVSPARPAPPAPWMPAGPPKPAGAAPAAKAKQPAMSYDGIVDRGQFLPDTAVLARFADRSTAEKVRKDLVSKRVAWKDAVRKHSLAPDREHDGDLGWSARVNFDPILADQVYTLEPGQISPVIRDSQGYQLFQCIEHQPMDPPAYEGIRSLIRGQIRTVKTAQRVDALQGLVREEIGMAYDTTAITWASAHFKPTMTSHQEAGGPSLEFNVDLPEF